MACVLALLRRLSACAIDAHATRAQEVFAVIMDFFASGAPVFKEDVVRQTSAADDDDEVVAMVKELLDTRIRPVIHEDGGDIEFVKMENGVVYVKLHVCLHARRSWPGRHGAGQYNYKSGAAAQCLAGGVRDVPVVDGDAEGGH
jgi:hypothetical protein